MTRLRRILFAAALAAALGPAAARQVHADDAAAAAAVSDAVLAAEADRVATIERITRPTIAIFDRNGQGGGSGVVISPDGYALTNYHVTAPCGPAMKCGLADGRFVDAVLVGLDPGGDMALIKLLGDGDDAFPVAELGDSDRARVGDWVYVAGNPFLLADDFQPTISYGILSGVHRYQYPAGTLLEYADCLQTDAAVNPGNSGGPLFDADGQLIGVNGRCSFEKRGRVNVGVGYAVSVNQIKRFLSHLKSGRLVDHASLGATVATDANGRVLVDDILEESDAYRRGLRYGDEVVRFGGRDISSANALKNALGTYPQGWRVPLVYRRDGTEHEISVRLAGAHREGELAAMMESPPTEPRPDRPPRPERPGGRLPPGEPNRPPHAPKSPDLPDAVKKFYEPRLGYANYWFNRHHQQRVWNAYLALGDFGDSTWSWTIRAKDPTDADVQIVLSQDHGSIVMPAGKSEAQFSISLDEPLSPPRSGGLLAALHLWQRLMIVGPQKFGEVYYFGTLPWPDERQWPDCLVGIHGGVETRFYFDPIEGNLVGLELQAADDQDPCEIYFSDFRPVAGRRLPHHWIVRHGDELFADFEITSYDWRDKDDAAQEGR
jgi:S1-C subfamily serine protease